MAKRASRKRESERSLISKMLKEHDLASRELKYFTYNTTSTMDAAGQTWALSQGIIQGDNIENREGMQINMIKVGFHLQCTMNNNATTENVRVIIFKDTQCRAAVPAVVDVLDTASVVSGYNVYWKQSNRFKIYSDETFAMSISGSNRSFFKQYKFRTGYTKVSYLGATDVAASLGPNQFFFLIITDLAANEGTYQFGFHFEYYDS